jgi:cobalt-zinc-cadmium efflux system protein
MEAGQSVHDHAHHHGHHHHHHHGATGSRLKWSLAVTTLFVAVEIVAGLRAHSLALLSDAGHNFTDAVALFLSWFCFYLQSKPADETKTYGYHRAGVLAAFVNAITLIGLSIWILWEGILRLRAPEHVDQFVMLAIAGLALLMNGGIMLSLRSASKSDINVRSAFIHMLGDALGSVAIMAGALIINFTGWERADPVLSIVIAGLIVWTAWDIVRESLNILLEGLPRGIDLAVVGNAMKSVTGVLGVHDLHIWSLGSSTHALSCHVLIEDVPPSASDVILQSLNHLLADRYRIFHTTVQFEHVSCSISHSGCAIPVSAEEHHHH